MLMSKWPFVVSGKVVSKKKKIIVVVAVVAAVLVLGGVAAWYFLTMQSAKDEAPVKNSQSINYEEAADEIKKTTLSSEELAKIVDNYGPQYDAALLEIQKSLPLKWDQALLDKAHFCLLYADKVGSRSQVESIYYQIFAAQQAGINVDANSAGVNQQAREEIFNRNQTPTTSVEEPNDV